MPRSTVGRSGAITGGGSGLGRDIALGLAGKGYLVFGTATSPAEADDLRQASRGRVSLAVCDIADETGVNGWAAGVSEALGETGLDLLISLAGAQTHGPIERLSLNSIRRAFDTNVFGAVCVVNAFLPALRKARGRIVQISCWTAHLALPFQGPWGATMAAMEVFAAAYRAELRRSGVDVVVAVSGHLMADAPAMATQVDGLSSALAVRQVIELAEQIPALRHAPVGRDAEDILRVVREGSEAEQDALRLRLAGLN
jgi:NAD(P)-dependent dehydrogenase (short-subunit alcohol dehydrogenase family)